MPDSKIIIEWCEKFGAECRACRAAETPDKADKLLKMAAQLAERYAKEELCRDFSERLAGQDERISELEERLKKLESKKSSAPKSVPLEKKAYGEYGNVRLTDKEHERLLQDFGEAVVKNYIRDVDEYCRQNGNKQKYKDFNVVIRSWIRRDRESGKLRSPDEVGEHSYNLDLLVEHSLKTTPKIKGSDIDGNV